MFLSGTNISYVSNWSEKTSVYIASTLHFSLSEQLIVAAAAATAGKEAGMSCKGMRSSHPTKMG